ncbi:MAG TPA: NADH-quinone oxidoreductase subunit N [Ktedonobacterales bacterium]|nr:NADH-quinone oxidoreductase subunit N [Ktedonobacterales bacterium]
MPSGSPFTYTPTGADWLRILPELILLGAALLVLLADLAPGSAARKGWLALVGLAGVIASGVAAALLFAGGDGQTAFYGMISADKGALAADVIILFSLGVGLLLSPGYVERQGVTQLGEYYALMLVAGLGMMMMASATNLMIVFVGLEVLSLALYVLSAFIIYRPRSQEAGLKYFILSSFASAFLLYGMALTYGATGSTNLFTIRTFVAAHPFSPSSGFGPLLLAALALLAVGFCFKVSAVPFQAWTPDVYVGAPTSVTTFMSVGTKVAAFVALARVFVVALHPVAPEWTPVLWAVAVLTMIGGNVLAVTQRDVKRMLAYSSVANAGYMLVAVVTATPVALASLLVYLATYAATNVGAFGVVLALERNDGLGTTLDDYAGLARRRPGVAAVMAIFLLSLAGVPLLAGFIGKYYVFYAAIVGGRLDLAIIGVLTSVLGMFYYLRVVWAMYFTEPQPAVVPAPAPSFAVAPIAAPVAPQPVPAGAAAGTVAMTVAAEPATGAYFAPEPTAAEARPFVAATGTRSVAQDSAPPRGIAPGAWLGLALALVATLVLGIVPAWMVELAVQAAQALLR